MLKICNNLKPFAARWNLHSAGAFESTEMLPYARDAKSE
jgi:hypothetical protein